jgi:hypothetical protein
MATASAPASGPEGEAIAAAAAVTGADSGAAAGAAAGATSTGFATAVFADARMFGLVSRWFFLGVSATAGAVSMPIPRATRMGFMMPVPRAPAVPRWISKRCAHFRERVETAGPGSLVPGQEAGGATSGV